MEIIMTLREYMDLSYDIKIEKIKDESGTYYYATVPELSGCQYVDETYEKAYNGILKAIEKYAENNSSGK